jgi:hypothetical protein
MINKYKYDYRLDVDMNKYNLYYASYWLPVLFDYLAGAAKGQRSIWNIFCNG